MVKDKRQFRFSLALLKIDVTNVEQGLGSKNSISVNQMEQYGKYPFYSVKIILFNFNGFYR